MAGWLKCPVCLDAYEFDPSYDGLRDEDGCGTSKFPCLNCWSEDDELQVPAVCCEASRPVPNPDDASATYDGGSGDDEPDDDWYANERAHRYDNPITD